jgi:uncharacterized membrane protein YphA (DoxX/SURF4 family)
VNVVLWILQILLGAVFLTAGTMKMTQPPEKLQKNLTWIEDVTPMQLRGIGLVEVLGGLGLILPWALDIARWLTPVAAVGLAIVMVLAAAVHAKRHEYMKISFNAILLVLAVVVAVGRF